MKKPAITFVIPTHNDETTIEDLLKQIMEVGGKYCQSFKIIVANDASTDHTGEILSKFAKTHKELTILTHKANLGYGATIKELYLVARTPWLFSLPGDFQIDPSEVIKLIPFIEKADMILGLREKRNDSPSRQLQSRTYNTLLRVFLGLPTTDVNSVRLLRTGMLKEFSLESTTAFVDAELVLKAHEKKKKIIEIPIIHRARLTSGGTGGNIKKTILPTIKDLTRCILLRFN